MRAHEFGDVRVGHRMDLCKSGMTWHYEREHECVVCGNRAAAISCKGDNCKQTPCTGRLETDDEAPGIGDS
ncbi:MAG: hypothetical protein K2W95_15535 [Candidatus Obscuribacterales bacterium]|nr:hypothetical protein [Candidatus Obscuribacterales bacterium]